MASYGSISKDAAVDGATDPPSFEETTPLVAPTTEKETYGHETAGLWSKLVFAWMIPLLSLGNEKKNMDPEDLNLVPLPHECETDFISEAFERCWKEELVRSNPSLIRALFRAFGWDFAVGGFCLKAIHDCCIFVGPQVLNSMIFFLKDADAPISTGLWLTAAVTLSQLTMSFCLRHYFFKCYLFGLRIRTAVVVAIYKKALVLSTGERQTRTLGEITNLMSIDAQRLQDLTTYLHAIWYSFLQISLALFFLFKQLGPSCLGGVVVIIVMMPVTKAVATWMGSMQKRLMHAKDQRVEINSEVLGSMKVIKLQAWEESFQDRILNLRNKELKQLLRYTLANSFSIMLWTAIPLAVALATFATYVISGHRLDVASALTSLALFDILRFPLFMLPQGTRQKTYLAFRSHIICVHFSPCICLLTYLLACLSVINRIVEAGISLARVRSFLLCDEYHSVEPGALEDVGIAMENVSSAYETKKPRVEGVDVDPMAKKLMDNNWEVSLLRSQLEDAQMKIKELAMTDKEREAMENTPSEEIGYLSGSLLCLKRISFECKPGELIAVVGGVGCGKYVELFLTASLFLKTYQSC
jgi:ABC-type multidrug transport system fused ATPase/permease subunit